MAAGLALVAIGIAIVWLGRADGAIRRDGIVTSVTRRSSPGDSRMLSVQLIGDHRLTRAEVETAFAPALASKSAPASREQLIDAYRHAPTGRLVTVRDSAVLSSPRTGDRVTVLLEHEHDATGQLPGPQRLSVIGMMIAAFGLFHALRHGRRRSRGEPAPVPS
jgi:hypothetical protein